MVQVKSKKYLDRLLMKLKDSVLSKSNESFSQAGHVVLRFQCRLCVLYVDDLRREIM